MTGGSRWLTLHTGGTIAERGFMSEIDEVVDALFELNQEEGPQALLKALGEDRYCAMLTLCKIRGCGVRSALEILLKTARLIKRRTT
jgi:hypothetical protein